MLRFWPLRTRLIRIHPSRSSWQILQERPEEQLERLLHTHIGVGRRPMFPDDAQVRRFVVFRLMITAAV
jgi:hypothetical protein